MLDVSIKFIEKYKTYFLLEGKGCFLIKEIGKK